MPASSSPPAASKKVYSIPVILMFTGGLVFLISLAFLLHTPRDSSIQPARQGQKMSNFALQSLDGNLVQLADFAGKTVLLNAWASWCPPCRAEMPDLIDFYAQHRDDNFIILAVNAGESKATASRFAEEMGLTFPVLLDSHFHLLDSLGIDSYPTSILVDPHGKIVKIHIGMFMPGDLEEEIAPFLEN